MAESNIETEYIYVIVFYILSGVMVIGLFYTLLTNTQFWKNFDILVIRKYFIAHFVLRLLKYMCMILFPVGALYLFTKLYVLKSKTLF